MKNGLERDVYGNKYWYKDDEFHRDDDLPAVEFANGDKAWFVNGKPHRLNGPAQHTSNGFKSWYQHGKLHRDDGPAVERADGKNEYYINGIRLSSKEDFMRIVNIIAFI